MTQISVLMRKHWTLARGARIYPVSFENGTRTKQNDY